MNLGSIVTCKNREWVLLPSDQKNLLMLRPSTGATEEAVAICSATNSRKRVSVRENCLLRLPTTFPTSPALICSGKRLAELIGKAPFRSGPLGECRATSWRSRRKSTFCAAALSSAGDDIPPARARSLTGRNPHHAVAERYGAASGSRIHAIIIRLHF